MFVNISTTLGSNASCVKLFPDMFNNSFSADAAVCLAVSVQPLLLNVSEIWFKRFARQAFSDTFNNSFSADVVVCSAISAQPLLLNVSED